MVASCGRVGVCVCKVGTGRVVGGSAVVAAAGRHCVSPVVWVRAFFVSLASNPHPGLGCKKSM